MRILSVGLWIVLSVFIPSVTAFAQAQPTPKTFQVGEEIWVELFFEQLVQGQAGVIALDGEGISQVTATFLGNPISFYQIDTPSVKSYAVVGVGIEQGSGSYTIDFLVQRMNQPAVEFSIPVQIAKGDFLQQSVTLVDPKIASLIDRTLEDNEYALLDELTQSTTLIRHWAGSGFGAPTTAELSSPFGAVRFFNETYETRHTGWDFNGGLGDTMNASASGRVVFAGNMAIRGNYVLIDHGYGIYSGYAHLSVINVVAGQFIRRGQVIGLAGTTGRSSSPHLHFEMRLNEKWIDPIEFINMWVP
ncbi:MAG: M23 family metallopeptidase [Phototrophicaceae bacterium]